LDTGVTGVVGIVVGVVGVVGFVVAVVGAGAIVVGVPEPEPEPGVTGLIGVTGALVGVTELGRGGVYVPVFGFATTGAFVAVGLDIVGFLAVATA
jgi:hypothetical protein